jgi:hypothetical protein
MFPVNQNSLERTTFNQFGYSTVSEEGQDFLDYLIRLGLLGESSLLVLSMRHHYYFEQNDLKDIRVLVIPKKLNLVKHLDSFLHIVFRVLPPAAYFIGCFTDNKSSKGKEFTLSRASTNINRFINHLDSKTSWYLDKNEVSRILESHGFKTVDLTEIKGQVYFASKNKRMSI